MLQDLLWVVLILAAAIVLIAILLPGQLISSAVQPTLEILWSRERRKIYQSLLETAKPIEPRVHSMITQLAAAYRLQIVIAKSLDRAFGQPGCPDLVGWYYGLVNKGQLIDTAVYICVRVATPRRLDSSISAPPMREWRSQWRFALQIWARHDTGPAKGFDREDFPLDDLAGVRGYAERVVLAHRPYIAECGAHEIDERAESPRLGSAA